MMINKSRFADGFIYFDDDKVDEAVRESLRINLSLNENLAPKNTMLIRKPIRIISKAMIDDRKLVPSCTSFPCIYKYKDATKNIDFEKPIFGPSVVYVIEAEVFGANKPLTFIRMGEKPLRL
ncbi:hypothetical protein B0I26_1281 [Anoxybacillus vitaminiphilus]|uniref:Uncharacterized protein n=1 Tax=Paranoxybacillus vitaminiphilus TaxID=581036 RepID=A0A327Y134_9BACL|nr:hypothetical protein [Anoxybacillus vitaminiphilus]RAK14928.1 hypothetical protein B0I26_1281 [Anoxybacillus vitaminiphilus]